MNFRDINSGEEFLEFLHTKLIDKGRLTINGGLADYAVLIYDTVFNVYILNDYEYANPYLCGYRMYETLTEALSGHSTGHQDYQYYSTMLDITWEETKWKNITSNTRWTAYKISLSRATWTIQTLKEQLKWLKILERS